MEAIKSVSKRWLTVRDGRRIQQLSKKLEEAGQLECLADL
jgi:hypothetical protein